MKPSEVLTGALKLLRKGWMQDDYSADGKYCILGAINQTVYGYAYMEGDDEPEDEAARKAVEAIVKKPADEYNDAPRRTKKQVLAVVKKAAENLRKVGQ